jgi:hypothetical protein
MCQVVAFFLHQKHDIDQFAVFYLSQEVADSLLGQHFTDVLQFLGANVLNIASNNHL